MLATLIATLILAPQAAPPACAVSGAALPANAPTVDALGARFRFCCADCAGKFKTDPPKHVAVATKEKRVAGTFLFDPVSGRRLTDRLARGGFATHGALRYGFESSRNRGAFEAAPDKFVQPITEVMFCPVMNVPLLNLYGTSGYVDVDGLRVYMCCDGCLGAMRASPGQFSALAKAKTTPAKAYDVPEALSKITWPPQ